MAALEQNEVDRLVKVEQVQKSWKKVTDLYEELIGIITETKLTYDNIIAICSDILNVLDKDDYRYQDIETLLNGAKRWKRL